MRGCFDVLSITSLYTKCKTFFVIFLHAHFFMQNARPAKQNGHSNSII